MTLHAKEDPSIVDTLEKKLTKNMKSPIKAQLLLK